ncbi:MAG: GIY-YIG nuclease family protein [Chitinophagaceae bacterium]
MPPSTHTLYILHSQLHNTIYIGQTSNLIVRFHSHNVYGKDWTKRYRPWMVIYCEYHSTRSEATKREQHLKSGKGREWIWNKINTELLQQGFISA